MRFSRPFLGVTRFVVLLLVFMQGVVFTCRAENNNYGELMYGISGTVSQGQFFRLVYASPYYYDTGYIYTAVLTPTSGDPDLYLHEKVNGVWKKLKQSVNGSGQVDRFTFTREDMSSSATNVDLDAYGYTGATFSFALYRQSMRFLSFPLMESAYSNNGAYSPNVIASVMDHRMDSVYAKDGEVDSFTGEVFIATPSHPTNVTAPCYPKSGGGAWSSALSGIYTGTTAGNCTDGVALNYDGHPGYDYVVEAGKPVYASAAGKVVNNAGTRCIPKGIPAGCDAWGAVGIDHGNGYITQYMHLNSIEVVAGQSVSGGQRIGLSGTKAPGAGVPAHLHFEVLKLKDGYPANYDMLSFIAADPYGYDTSKGVADYVIRYDSYTPSRCLWKFGCP